MIIKIYSCYYIFSKVTIVRLLPYLCPGPVNSRLDDAMVVELNVMCEVGCEGWNSWSCWLLLPIEAGNPEGHCCWLNSICCPVCIKSIGGDLVPPTSWKIQNCLCATEYVVYQICLMFKSWINRLLTNVRQPYYLLS